MIAGVILFTSIMLAIANDKMLNVALHKPATQIDTYTEDVGGAADRAVDGNTDTNYFRKSCSHTKSAKNTWWMVDLLGHFTVFAVKLTNRDSFSHRLRDFTVFVSRDNPLKSQQFPNITPRQQCFYRKQQISAGQTEMISCTTPIIGRYLVVFKPANEYLTICEIEVLATNASDMDYRGIQGSKLTRKPFYTVGNISCGTSCIFRCRRAPDGSATAIQYQRSDQLCECLQVSGFETTVPELDYDRQWILFLAISN